MISAYASDTPSLINDAAGTLIYKDYAYNIFTDVNGAATFHVSTYRAGNVTMKVQSADQYDTGKPMAAGASGTTLFTFGNAKNFPH